MQDWRLGPPCASRGTWQWGKTSTVSFPPAPHRTRARGFRALSTQSRSRVGKARRGHGIGHCPVFSGCGMPQMGRSANPGFIQGFDRNQLSVGADGRNVAARRNGSRIGWSHPVLRVRQRSDSALASASASRLRWVCLRSFSFCVFRGLKYVFHPPCPHIPGKDGGDAAPHCPLVDLMRHLLGGDCGGLVPDEPGSAFDQSRTPPSRTAFAGRCGGSGLNGVVGPGALLSCKSGRIGAPDGKYLHCAEVWVRKERAAYGTSTCWLGDFFASPLQSRHDSADVSG